MSRAVISGALALVVGAVLVLERANTTYATPHAVIPAIAAPIAKKPARDAPGGTTLLVLRLGPRGLELVSATEKAMRCELSSEGTGVWVLEDADTGARLAEGCCDLPELCTCDRGGDHAQGCIVRRHAAVFRIKVPRSARHERLRVLAATGREVGVFSLE